MCKIGIMLGTAGENLPSAILFMNSNKSEKNIRKKVAKTREKCLSHGIKCQAKMYKKYDIRMYNYSACLKCSFNLYDFPDIGITCA